MSEKIDKIIDEVANMSVMEVFELVKKIEDKFEVSAAAMVSASPTAGDTKAEEQTEFNVILTAIGPNKVNVIKEVRSITSLGLKEAKDLVEAAPKAIKESVTKEEAEKIKKQLEAAGASVEIK